LGQSQNYYAAFKEIVCLSGGSLDLGVKNSP
jgi:hypothetical protein